MPNRLVLIGNGFDLAHGLKTTYNDFLDWYMSDAFVKFVENRNFQDDLIEMKNKYARMLTQFDIHPKNFQEILQLFSNNSYHSIIYKSRFYQRLLDSFSESNWVNIECYYFQRLKNIFNRTEPMPQKQGLARELNREFNYLIRRLSEYFNYVNSQIANCKQLSYEKSRSNFHNAIKLDDTSPVTFLNFNYTDTLFQLRYANDGEIIHIHGQASYQEKNPIIFGYGDETDPTYQEIEDSGENVFLEHIKSFGYFKTDNYRKLISLIDSAPYTIYIVGHSCGLSDRILLNTIFEHPNCDKIEIFYHIRKDGSDNFTEITQEISRHFRPQNKGLMRRRISFKDSKNTIPQNMH